MALVAVLFCWMSVGVTPLPAQRRGTRPAPAPASAPASPAATPPAPIGLVFQEKADRQGTVIEVVSVVPGSPAAAAGVQAGDVLVTAKGQPINSLKTAKEIILAGSILSARSGQPFPLRFRRGQGEVTVQITPAAPSTASASGRPSKASSADQRMNARMRGFARGRGATAVASGEAVDPFLIPGLAPRDSAPAGINVLQRVFLDPESGQLAFVGRYDPAYATGAIDYSTLLHDAWQSPAPSFSLEPTAATKAGVDAFVRGYDQQMDANLRSVESGKTWMVGMFDQLLTNPALEVDRRRFLAKGAGIFRVKPEEVPPYMQAMLNRTEMGSPPWINFWAKLFERLGAPEAAQYMRAAANKSNDPGAFQAALDGLGMRPVIEDYRNRMNNGAISQAAAERILEAEVWAAIYSRCRVPESRWLPAVTRVRQGGSIDAFRATLDVINVDLVTQKVMDVWLNGLVLSETFLQVMNRMPPLEVAPDYRGNLAPDSELARTFLAADWTLKNLTVTPELADRVPGHLTPTQFIFQQESQHGVYDLGNVEARFWLTPGSVALRCDPAGTVLDFGPAVTSVRAEVLSHQGGSAAAERVTRDAIADYAREITRRYDEYARALPDLHRLREAAKILALVHWAQARGLKLVPPSPPAPPCALPASFRRGFWTAYFLANPEKTFFGLAASGGVDFGNDIGTAWVQPREDPALAKTAVQQLAASAALGQQAAAAAGRGDLEAARSLADQSARAMTGDIDLSANPALGAIPEVPPPERVADVELQGELVTQTNREISALTQASSTPGPKGETQRAQSQEHLRELEGLLASEPPAPAQARQIVKLLRNGDWGSLPAAAPRTPAVATAPAPAPAPAVVDPAERARIRGEITELRVELCRIQRQLRRFNATVQMDQDQRDQWVKVTNDAYQSALDRAKEKLADFTVDFPEGELGERLKNITDPVERAKLERALRLVQHLKEAYSVKDFATWAANEDYGPKEILEGIGMITDLLGVDEKITDYLKKRWGLGRVLAFKDAAQDLVTSAYDVTAEVVAWRRLKQLNQNSDSFLLAVQKSGERIREVMEGIRQREIRLGLDPGSTKEPCGD